MAKIIYPTQEQWAVLEELGLAGHNRKDGRVVIVSPHTVEQLRESTGLDPDHTLTYHDPSLIPDFIIDVVESDDHSAFDVLANELRRPDEVLERKRLLQQYRAVQAKLTFYED